MRPIIYCLFLVFAGIACNLSDPQSGAQNQADSGRNDTSGGMQNNGNDSGSVNNGVDGGVDGGTNGSMCVASECAERPGAIASCVKNVCSYVCEPGLTDENDDLGSPAGDGCEATCIETNDGVELCDDEDNDCDGVVDNGFDLGDACVAGVGECEAVGEVVCSDDQMTSRCNAIVGSPSAEICDGLDNNCDGTDDEDNPQGGGTCDTGAMGACQNGTELCRDGGIVCEANNQPTTEACGTDNTGDGIDNDCDGTVDEECAECVENSTRECYTGPANTAGVGACQRGTQTCTGGVYGACENEQLPSSETCNGVDDDCDGVADETYSDKGDQCSAGVGLCAANGVQVCRADGQGTECNATPGTPGTETCNGLDDDCDGATDESLTRPCGSDVGICMRGTETCTSGQWGTCTGGVSAGTETCNALDDDCDGSVDDGFNIGSTCSVGVGECQNSGTIACIQNGTSACNATPGPSSPEVCNNLDDDCDGSTDESLNRSCSTNVGACTAGTETCSSGVWGTCSGTLPRAETCNNVDDDCDGTTDESLNRSCSTNVGECTAGTETCSSGAWGSCSGVLPRAEICNNKDDDCDGTTDESLSRSCSTNVGECTVGTETCSAGGWVNCSGVLPSTEICNSKDDDCDGTTDEGFSLGSPCSVGTGACRRTGSTICNVSGSGTQCNATPGSPSPESSANACSDGIDNDCDGRTDCSDIGCNNQACIRNGALGTCQNGSCQTGGICVGGCSSGQVCCDGRCYSGGCP